MNDWSRARRRIELYRVYKLPVFLRPRRAAGERTERRRVYCVRPWVRGEFFFGGRGGPQGPVCVRSVYTAAAAVADVISEFDSLSALPDLRQISQSE